MKLEPRGNFCFLKIRTNPNKLFPYPVGPLVHCAKNVLLIFQLACKYGEPFDINIEFWLKADRRWQQNIACGDNRSLKKMLCITIRGSQFSRHKIETPVSQNWTSNKYVRLYSESEPERRHSQSHKWIRTLNVAI